ncbi:MAG: hypothetical protein ACRDJ4_02295 [Actinomycetota bacterium]
MARYLVTATHTPEECLRGGREFAQQPRANELLETTYFGCPHGVHQSWTVAEFEGEEEAREVIPAIFRERARIVPVEVLTFDEAMALHAAVMAEH